MFSFVFYLCFVLQPILYYNSVYGRRESLKRYILEKGAKPAIFGSYSYDPVRQVFVPPPKNSSTNAEQTTRPHREIEAYDQTTTDETNRLNNHGDDKKNDDDNDKHDDHKKKHDDDNKKHDDYNKKHDDDNKKHDDDKKKHDDDNNQQHDSSTTPEFMGSSTIGITEHSDLLRKHAGQI